MNEITTGVASGVVTAALLGLVVKVFNTIILPWYRSQTYRGIDINGDWESTHVTESETGEKGRLTFSLYLNQKAHDVTGTLVIFGERDDKPRSVQMEFRGQVWEGYLNGTLRSSDSRRLSFATLLFKVTDGGRTLAGIYCYRKLKGDGVSQFTVEFQRKNDERVASRTVSSAS
jgi:hypothetical protein